MRVSAVSSLLKTIIFVALIHSILGYAAPLAKASDFWVAPKIGTLGVGADLGWQVTDKFKLRANGNWLAYDHDETIDSVDYDANLRIFSLGLLADIHPAGNGWRVTFGAYYLDNKLDLDANLDPNETVTIGDQTFTGAQLGELDGNAKFNNFAPYLGIGYGVNADANQNWHFTFDLGALFVGSARVNLSASNPLGLPNVAEEVKKEENEVEDELDSYQWYPVIAIGVAYRF